MGDLQQSRGEVRLVVGIGALLAGSAVVSSVSPGIEAFLNAWVGNGCLIAGGAVIVFLVLRSVWLSLLIEWELRRPLPPGARPWRPPARETELEDDEAADA